MGTAIRVATALDEEAILALAHGERVNPMSLHWPNFVVAVDDQRIIGAVQLRHHRNGSRELGTLMVERRYRNNGIAARLIDALLENHTGRVLMITGKKHADHYLRWGFVRIEPRSAPRCVRRNYRLGYSIGRVVAFFQRRPVNHLVILNRPVLEHQSSVRDRMMAWELAQAGYAL